MEKICDTVLDFVKCLDINLELCRSITLLKPDMIHFWSERYDTIITCHCHKKDTFYKSFQYHGTAFTSLV